MKDELSYEADAKYVKQVKEISGTMCSEKNWSHLGPI